jgi:hypothetical protein
MLPRLASCVLGLLGWFAATSSFALERMKEGLPERPALIQAVRRQFLANDFAGLEKRAAEARAGARFSDGCWQLSSFFGAFTLSSQAPDAAWEAWLRRFEAWDNAVPGSITARIARAEAWTARASSGAGSRFTDSVAEVRQILETCPEAKACPVYYQIMMWVAASQNWPKEEFEKVFSSAVALAPDYEQFYFRKAGWISGRENEYGGGHAWANFAVEAPALTSRPLGAGIYTRIVWSMLDKSVAGAAMENAGVNGLDAAEQAALQQKANADSRPTAGLQALLLRTKAKDGALKSAGVDWGKMKQGFQDLERLYPQSLWNKNAFCFYAFCANDRETTALLMAELQDRFTPAVWPSEEYFNQVKEWARTGKLP